MVALYWNSFYWLLYLIKEVAILLILENVFTVRCVFVMQKGLTALMYAVQREHVRVVKELLLAGADGTARDRVRISLVRSNERETCCTCASAFDCI